MKKFETLSALDRTTQSAVVALLYRLGDDALILGHRGAEWTGLAPILEEDLAFSSMAQDDMGHAHVFYQMLHELGEPDPDTIAFARKPEAWKCAAMMCLPNERDWAFCLLRKYLYDAAASIRLTALAKGSLVPLAQLAVKLRSEKKYHLMHGRAWILRLGDATEDSRLRMRQALDKVYPYALGMFEPTGEDETLMQAGVSPGEEQLRTEWESTVAPILNGGGLSVPENATPVVGGRIGQHPPELSELLDSMQLVYNIDPAAKW